MFPHVVEWSLQSSYAGPARRSRTAGRVRLGAVVVLIVLAAGCGGAEPGSALPTGPTAGGSPAADPTAGPMSEWPFEDEVEAAGEPEVVPPDAEPDTADAEILDEVAVTGAEGAEADDTALEEFDPCELVTPAEWAGWRGVPVDEVTQVELEGGEACGYMDTSDEVRLAVAVIDMSDGSWLPDDLQAEDVEVGSLPGRWVTGYPVEVSSVLVVTLDGAELVLELSARNGIDRALLRDGAIGLASGAVSRWSPS